MYTMHNELSNCFESETSDLKVHFLAKRYTHRLPDKDFRVKNRNFQTQPLYLICGVRFKDQLTKLAFLTTWGN